MSTTIVLQYLKDDPRFRERVNKNKGLANLISKKYNIEIPKEQRADIIGDILNWDRAWRQILKDTPELRGEDYDEKAILEQEKMLELGYDPSYHADMKKLNEIDGKDKL